MRSSWQPSRRFLVTFLVGIVLPLAGAQTIRAQTFVGPSGLPWPESMMLLPPAPATSTTLEARSVAGGPGSRDWERTSEIRLHRYRDATGFKRYTLLFDGMSSGATSLQLRARFRKDGGSRLIPTNRTTAFGFAMPWDQYVFELEGVDQSGIGRSLFGTIRWHDSSERFECGLTVPMVGAKELTGAVILQFVYRFDSDTGRTRPSTAMPALFRSIFDYGQ